MNTPDNTYASTTPLLKQRAPKWFTPVLLLAVIAGVFALKMILPPHWHALLELKNTGTKVVTIVFKGHSTLTKPGETWKREFRANDKITIHAGETTDAPAHTITMPAKNPKPWTISESTAQHWTAEVNADDPANIRVEKRQWTEVTNPPSPWQPWP